MAISTECKDALVVTKNGQPVALIATLSYNSGLEYIETFLTSMTRLRYMSAEMWDVFRYQT